MTRLRLALSRWLLSGIGYEPMASVEAREYRSLARARRELAALFQRVHVPGGKPAQHGYGSGLGPLIGGMIGLRGPFVLKDECTCPAPQSLGSIRTDYGRGWTISEDWKTWTCSRCAKPASDAHVEVLTNELARSMNICRDIYAGRKP